MKCKFVTVAFHTQNQIQLALECFARTFPNDRPLVVNNNPTRDMVLAQRWCGRTDIWAWAPHCDEETEWLQSRKDIDLIALPAENRIREHADGLNLARAWCLANGYDSFCLFEPDCAWGSAEWFTRMAAEMAGGAWLVGPIWPPKWPGESIFRIAPSIWLLEPTREISFSACAKGSDRDHPRYAEVYRECYPESWPENWSRFWLKTWDTALKAWFYCAVRDRVRLVDVSDCFRHAWHGCWRGIGKMDMFKWEESVVSNGRTK